MPSVAGKFKGIPMGDLIGGPLTASCAAQFNLARAMVHYIDEIGFKSEDGGEDTEVGGETRLVKFDLTRPVDLGQGEITTESIEVQAPLLGLVPIPALLIDLVTVDFTMEVKDHVNHSDKTDASLDAKAKVGWGVWSASVQGHVATHRENTRSTDNSAKYNVHVQARQQPPTEGLAKMMDLLASVTAPIKVTPPTAPTS